MATISSDPRLANLPDDIDNRLDPIEGRAPLVLRGHGFKEVTDIVTNVNLRPLPIVWWYAFIPNF